jgi:hypothetical protein
MSAELSALLCPACHRKYHDSDADDTHIWKRVLEINTPVRVLGKLTELKAMLKHTLDTSRIEAIAESFNDDKM